MATHHTTLVHLSDLHLTARDTDPRSEPKLFGRLTGMNAAFRTILHCEAVQQADRILITGDITDSGRLEEWEVFWTAVEAAKVKERLVLTPGNHDLCCLGLRPPLPGTSAARHDFDRFLTGLRAGGLVLPDGRYPTPVPIGNSIVVFVLNSNNMGNFSALSNAVGELPYYDLERFARLLYRYRQCPVKIVALHHSPNIPGPATARRRGDTPMTDLQRLSHQIPEDQRRLMRLLCLSHRVRLIIHGHLHRKEDRTVNGIRIIGAPASTEPATVKGQPCYRFWKYDIATGNSCRISHQLYDLPVG